MEATVARIRYIALKHMERVGDGDKARTVRVGEEVPEAASWDPIWQEHGWFKLEVVDDDDGGTGCNPVSPVTPKRPRGRPRKAATAPQPGA